MNKPRNRRAQNKSIQKKLDADLHHLENAQLVRRTNDIDLAYLFKHTLTQETVYESLLRSTRREIHSRVAQAVELLYANQLDENAAILAQHYAQAGDDAKALEYSTRAGDVAARMYANSEATMHYARAIEIAKRHGETVPSTALRSAQDATSVQNLYLKRGRAFEHCAQHAQALASYQEMEALAIERGDRGMELAALMARATLHATPTPMQNLDLGRTLLDKALALAGELNDRAAESKALWNLMLLESFSGHQAHAVELGEQALGIARALGLQEQTAYVLNDIARNYSAVGQIDEARAALDEARGLWQAMGNLPMLADNFATSADNAASIGKYTQAIEFAEHANQISQSIGNLWNQAYSRWIMGNVYFDRGEFGQAIAAMTDTMRLGDQAGFAVAAWIARVVMAMLHGELGMPKHGIALLEPQVELVRKTDVSFKPWGFGVLSYLYLLVGNPAQAESFVIEARTGANLDDLGNLVPIILTMAEGALAMTRQQFAEVEQMTHDLLVRYRAAKSHLFKSDVMLLASQALHAQGKIDQARTMLKQARDEAETIGVRRVLWKILAEWSVLETESGNHAHAESLRVQAQENIAFIAAHMPQELRASFLNLPTVRQVMQNVKPA